MRAIRFCWGCNEGFASYVTVCPSCGEPMEEVGPSDLRLDTTTLEALGRDEEPLREPAADLSGQEIACYRLDELAGQGGMARVYRAHHLTLHRTCALKVLHPRLAESDPSTIDLFLQEARAAASLVHPNIVTVHNIVEADGLHLIELEWVEGMALDRLIANDQRLDPLRATEIMAQVATALASAHRRDIVHRDLKPSNVLMAPSGVAKLSDFGLAKRLLPSGDGHSELAGTPHFMAPELFRGEAFTPACDVYAAGVMYFMLMSGSLPFRARTLAQVISAHKSRTFPDLVRHLPEMPSDAQQILATCLAKDPAKRYPHGLALQQALRELLGGLRSLEGILEEAFEGLDVVCKERARGGYEVSVPLPGGRSQRVLIEERLASESNERLVEVLSPCGPVREAYLRRALEINNSVHHGSLAIQEVFGTPYFVMRNAYPRATCDPLEIRRSVLSIAENADRMESWLTGRDFH